MTINEFIEQRPKPSHHASPEHQLQVQCVRWFRLQYPKVKIWSNANGGQRNIVVATRMKAEGVLKGVPDLTVAAVRKGFHGLYIEMKNGKRNNPSPEQKALLDYLNNEGYQAVVVRSFAEFQQVVNDYLSE